MESSDASKTTSVNGNGGAPAQPQATRRPRPKITGVGGGSTILVNQRQRGNPVLTNIRNVGWEFSVIVPDYQVGPTSAVLFLSLRYHRLHPEYIHQRISSIGNMFSLRILLVQCDINDHQAPVKELTKIALINNLTMMMAWSAEEAGRYIETYKTFERKSHDMIRERINEDYPSQINAVLTQIRSVNKTDVMTLLTHHGSLRNMTKIDPDTLGNLPGFGDIKVKQIREAFNQPFRVGEIKTMRQRRKQEALRAAERGEDLPDDFTSSLRAQPESSKRATEIILIGQGRASSIVSSTPADFPNKRVARESTQDFDDAFDDSIFANLPDRITPQPAATTASSSLGGAAGSTSPSSGSTGVPNEMDATLKAAMAFRSEGFDFSKYSRPDDTNKRTLAGIKSGAKRIVVSGSDSMADQQMTATTSAAKSGPTAAREDSPSLADFENLTEEEQLRLAIAMSNGGE